MFSYSRTTCWWSLSRNFSATLSIFNHLTKKADLGILCPPEIPNRHGRSFHFITMSFALNHFVFALIGLLLPLGSFYLLPCPQDQTVKPWFIPYSNFSKKCCLAMYPYPHHMYSRLVMTAKFRNWPRHLSYKWLKKRWYTHTQEYYSAI